jgi:N-acetylglucosamine-6-phosphate deacetylase
VQKIVVHNGLVYTPTGPLEHAWILIEDGVITAIGQGQHPACDTVIDAQQLALIPGFIDLHVHGAAGCDTMQATPQALYTMANYFAKFGVTSFLAATITESAELTRAAVQNIAACVGPIPGGARLLGAYLEGPYINVQAKGAHTLEHIRPASKEEYIPLLETGVIKQITIAPEIPENIHLIKECAAYNCMPVIGHCMADYEQAHYAIALGMHQATHTFNAMSGMHHRAPGTTGAVLTNDAVTCELIADNVHVHPAMLKLAVRAKGADKIVLVTDAEIGTGLTPGFYDFGRCQRHIESSGVYLPNKTLAGSVLTMNKALYNCMQATGLSLADAWPMSSYNAARQLGLEHKKGKIAVGYDADVVIFDASTASIAMTIGEGVILYTNSDLPFFMKEFHERTSNATCSK